MLSTEMRQLTTQDGDFINVMFLGSFYDSLLDEIILDYGSTQSFEFDEGWINSRECHGQFGSWETVTLDGLSYCVKIPDELADMLDDGVDNTVIEAIINNYLDNYRRLEHDD